MRIKKRWLKKINSVSVSVSKNFFITLEGGEGVGKSTALDFIRTYFENKKVACVFTREPGGTKVGESIRDILLHHRNLMINPQTELLLMFAARAQHLHEVIRPALSLGKTVISDRFTDASFAYQGGGRQMPLSDIQLLTEYVQGDFQPDLTLLLDAPVEIGLARMSQRGEKDRIEEENVAFFNRVRESYLERANAFPQRFVIIHADQSIENVQSQIKRALDTVVLLKAL